MCHLNTKAVFSCSNATIVLLWYYQGRVNKVTLKMTRTHFFIRQIALSHFSLMAPQNWLFSG